MTALAVNDEVRSSADVALIVGSRMGETDWWGKALNWAKPGSQATIQIDNDEARLGVNKPVTVALLADAKEALRALADAVEELGAPPNKQVRIKALEGGVRSGTPNAPNSTSRWPATVRRSIRARPIDRPVGHARGHGLGFDGGNTAVWSNFYHDANVPRTTLSTFKFGMLGAGMGQSLVRLSRHRTSGSVYSPAMVHSACTPVRWRARCGSTCRSCSSCWWTGRGMVKMSQQIAAHPVATVARKMLTNKSLPDDQVVYADFAPCRYDLMAEAFGAHGEHVTDSTQLRGALERARDCAQAAVVQVDVNNVEHLWAPALQSFKKMHQEPKG